MTIKRQQFDELQKLAAIARPMDDDDYGSERQVDAENIFWNACAKALGAPYDDGYDGSGLGEDFDRWCLKATTEEMLDEAIAELKKLIAFGS